MAYGITDPNQVVLQALGGQTPANNLAASTLAPTLSNSLALQSQFQNFLAGAAPLPMPQQEPPELNIDALRKISDPRIMQMAFGMLMQREQMRMRQQGQEYGVYPGAYRDLTPAERRAATLATYFGTGAQGKDLMDELQEAQQVINWGTEIVEEPAPIDPDTKMVKTDPDTGEPMQATKRRQVRPGQEAAVRAAERRIVELTRPGDTATPRASPQQIQEAREFMARSGGQKRPIQTQPAAKTTDVPPTGLGAIWPKLDDEEKTDIRAALKRGVTINQIIRTYTETRKAKK